MAFIKSVSGETAEYAGSNSNNLTTIGLVWSLAGVLRPSKDINGFVKRAEYLLRLLPYLHWIEKLRSLLNDNSSLQTVLYAKPALLDTLRRPYHDSRLGLGRRYALLAAHYQWLGREFTGYGIRQVFLLGGISIARIQSAQLGTLELKLVSRCKYDKEGELTLVLENSKAECLCALTFCIDRNEAGSYVMRIAGLQGGTCGNEYFKTLTKECHGMRPFALMLHVAQRLAAGTHIKEIKAVSTRFHVYRHWRYRNRQDLAPKRSYDEFWEGLKAAQRDDGWFALPLEAETRSPVEIASNKRAMYARRKLLLEDIDCQINYLIQNGNFVNERVRAA